MKRVRYPLLLSLGLCMCIAMAYAQNEAAPASPQKQVNLAADTEIKRAIEEARVNYFKEHKYSEFLSFLESLAKEKKALEPVIDYYIALCRFAQLGFLEESQNWNEYFGQGDAYRNQIKASLEKAIALIPANDPFNIYAKLLLYRFYHGQGDPLAEAALDDLMKEVAEYAKSATELLPIKEAADQLFSSGEKSKSRLLYKLYMQKLVNAGMEDSQVADIAISFYEKNNLELSELAYDIYVERILKRPKEEAMTQLLNIAKTFCYNSQGIGDPAYAEKIFAKAQDLGGMSGFSEEFMYRRALNLEEAKDYPKARDIYEELLKSYPQSAHADEANYKIGVIYTYVLGDIKNGKETFIRIAQKETISWQLISSLYQLGLLSQWEADNAKASQYYTKLLNLAKDSYPESVASAKERLEEIGESEDIDYNLKSFLDVILKQKVKPAGATGLDLKPSSYSPKAGSVVELNSSPYATETGCMQVELQYFWSGDTGTSPSALSGTSFSTTYSDPGTKVINLLVSSPSGTLDHGLLMLNVN